jgi:hypothetical protein
VRTSAAGFDCAVFDRDESLSRQARDAVVDKPLDQSRAGESRRIHVSDLDGARNFCCQKESTSLTSRTDKEGACAPSVFALWLSV